MKHFENPCVEFNRSLPEFNPDCLATDTSVEIYLGLGKGVISVKRSRGTWPIETRKIGRCNRTRVGDVLDHYVPLDSVA